jgi:fumarylacetoacetase
MATTHPDLRSFVDVSSESHFPIQNLPYGVFRRPQQDTAQIGVAIGTNILDLRQACLDGLLVELPARVQSALCGERLNELMALGRPAWTATRAAVTKLLRADEPSLRDHQRLRDRVLVPMSAVEMLLPVEIGDYTDFYSSRDHATNVGVMLRGPDNALMPNWLHLPVAYHGRAGSVVVSGTDLHRPRGQTKADDAPAPTFGPSRALDFELEMGFFTGPPNELGRPIPIAEAADHIFGMVLVNDWSARDIQKWEYQPLGPFLAKNFGTSISPWVVTLEALEPFRVVGPVQDPPPLPHLRGPDNGSYDIRLEVLLQSSQMDRPVRICASNSKNLYWSIHQQLAHHTSNGCNVRPGDLLASGTISGPTPESRGSLLELAWKGTKPIALPSGATRTFLEDGDRVTMTGWCDGPSFRVGFGSVTGRILPAAE